MKLSETSEMMNSSDYKERFRAEYLQLKIRIDGLSAMLEKYKAGTLPFTPTCTFELLNKQLQAMKTYLVCLKERATHEDINCGILDEVIAGEDISKTLDEVDPPEILEDKVSEEGSRMGNNLD